MALKPFSGTLDETPTLKPFAGELDAPTQAAPAPIARPSGLVRRVVGDTAVDLGKGVIGVGEAAVGLGNLVSGGYVGKGLEAIGYDPATSKKMLEEGYTPERVAANKEVGEAKGFLGTTAAMLRNPSTIAGAAVESAPLMLGGGAVAQGLKRVIASPIARGAIGEGLIGAGAAAESIRQQSDDGLLSAKQTGAAIGAGAGTAVLGAAGGKLAQKFGIADVDVALAGGNTLSGPKKNILRRVAEGALAEGVFEELPQSVQETMWQNYATGKPLMEGVPEGAAMGMLAGGVMGGGFSAIARPGAPVVHPPIKGTDSGAIDTSKMGAADPATTVAQPATPDPLDGSVINADLDARDAKAFDQEAITRGLDQQAESARVQGVMDGTIAPIARPPVKATPSEQTAANMRVQAQVMDAQAKTVIGKAAAIATAQQADTVAQEAPLDRLARIAAASGLDPAEVLKANEPYDAQGETFADLNDEVLAAYAKTLLEDARGPQEVAGPVPQRSGVDSVGLRSDAVPVPSGGQDQAGGVSGQADGEPAIAGGQAAAVQSEPAGAQAEGVDAGFEGWAAEQRAAVDAANAEKEARKQRVPALEQRIAENTENLKRRMSPATRKQLQQQIENDRFDAKLAASDAPASYDDFDITPERYARVQKMQSEIAATPKPEGWAAQQADDGRFEVLDASGKLVGVERAADADAAIRAAAYFKQPATAAQAPQGSATPTQESPAPLPATSDTSRSAGSAAPSLPAIAAEAGGQDRQGVAPSTPPTAETPSAPEASPALQTTTAASSPSPDSAPVAAVGQDVAVDPDSPQGRRAAREANVPAELLAQRDAADARMKAASAAMAQFPKGDMGLTPDAVKATPEWKAARKEMDKATAVLRGANAAVEKARKAKPAAPAPQTQAPEQPKAQAAAAQGVDESAVRTAYNAAMTAKTGQDYDWGKGDFGDMIVGALNRDPAVVERARNILTNGNNETGLKVFFQQAGMKMPRTQREQKAAFDAYIGVSPETRAASDAEKAASKQTKREQEIAARRDRKPIPEFKNAAEADRWWRGRAEAFPSQGAYRATPEYSEFLEKTKDLYAKSKEDFTAARNDAMKAAGIAAGDRVRTSQVGAFLSVNTFTGTVVMRGGVPWVKLDAKVPTSRKGRSTMASMVRWSAEWKKVEEIPALPVQTDADRADLEARAAEQEPKIAALSTEAAREGLAAIGETKARDLRDPKEILRKQHPDDVDTALKAAAKFRAPTEEQKAEGIVATQGPDDAKGERKFYVTIIRDSKVARLAGPFDTKEEAEGMVDRASSLARELDPRASFDSFGVSAVTSENHKPGRLNEQLGLPAPSQQQADQKSEPKPAAQAASEPAPTAEESSPVANTLSLQDALYDKLRDGTATLDEYKAGWQALQDNRAAILAELEGMKKDALVKIAGMRARSETKPQLVKSAFGELESNYSIGRGISYGMTSGNSLLEAYAAQVAGTTEADLKAFADKWAEARAARAARITGAKDPKTLSEFEDAARLAGGETKLTAEQRATFDRLRADARREQRDADAKRNAVVRQVDTGGTGMEIVETKHTQKGHDLFVVKTAERVDAETYKALNAAAKRLGGYYSSYRGNGAIPGFTFTSRENAESFMAVREGNVDASGQQQARAEARAESRAESLAEKAANLKAKAEESLGRDRKANTQRRASQAAHAEADARQQLALANTMAKLAEAIDAGRARMLGFVRHKNQVEMFESAVKQAHWEHLRSQGVNWEKAKEMPLSAESLTDAKLPAFHFSRGDAITAARRLIATRGGKAFGESLAKMVDYGDEYGQAVQDNPYKFVVQKSKADGTEKDLAFFATKTAAQAALRASQTVAEARGLVEPRFVVVKMPRAGKTSRVSQEWAVAMSPALAIERKLWAPDYDKKVNLNIASARKIVELLKVSDRGDSQVPYWWTDHLAKRDTLAKLGIETNYEYREALREYLALREAPSGEDTIRKLERALVGNKAVGVDFFPTPPAVIQRLMEQADIQPGMRVLEPSAGKGDIAEAARDAAENVTVDTVEMSSTLREILEAKGFEIIGQDFLAVPAEPVYDRIVMNPPFLNDNGAAHVRHAYSMLKPGGRLVAIMGNGSRGAEAFEAWLEKVGGLSEPLPEGSFKSSFRPTGVATKVVEIERGDGPLESVEEMDPADLTPAERASFDRQSIDRSKLRAELSRRNGEADADALGLRKAVDAVLGKLGVKVTYLRGNQGLPPDMLADLERKAKERGVTLRTAGLFHPVTKEVFVFTDVARTPQMAAFTASHEIAGHQGLRALLGDRLNAVLDLAVQNPTVKAVADHMYTSREMYKDVRSGKKTERQQRLLSVEEALADLAAAKRTGNWQRITDKHGVEVPKAMQSRLRAMIDNLVQRIKDLFRRKDVRFSDAQVLNLLENAWQAAQGNRASMSVVGADGALEQVVFHGTPHSVDKFSLNKIGTGEGAAAYGWGIYFASAKDVANAYTGNLGIGGSTVPTFFEINGKKTESGTPEQKAADLIFSSTSADARRLAKSMLADAKAGDEWTQAKGLDYYQRVFDLVSTLKKSEVKKAAGSLYRVDVPEDGDLLDWDKPLSKQPEKVRAALASMGVDAKDDTLGSAIYFKIAIAEENRLWDDANPPASQQQLASEALLRAGIPGLRYLDGTSRTKGEGSANYVIWDESAIGTPESALESTEDQTRDPRPEVVAYNEAQSVMDLDAGRFLVRPWSASVGYGKPIERKIYAWDDSGKRLGVLAIYYDDIDGFGIGGIEVDAQHRRKGVGTRLLNAAFELHPEASQFKILTGLSGNGRALMEQYGLEQRDGGEFVTRPTSDSILESVEAFTLSDNPTLDEVRIPGEVRLAPIYKTGFKGVLQRLGQKFADVKPHLLATVPLNHLVDFAPKGVPAIGQYVDIQYQMQAFRNALYTKYDKVAQDLLKFSAEGKGVRGWFGMTVSQQGRDLFSLMHDSTIAGVDPTKDGYPDEKVTQFEALKARYEALPEEGQRLYRETRDAYKAQSDLLDETISNNFRRAMEITQTRAERAYKAKLQEINESGKSEDEKIKLRGQAANAYDDQVTALEKNTTSRLMALREMLESQRVQEPYFPLKRYGKHWVTVLDKSGTMVGFSKFQTTAEQEAFSKEMQAKGYTTRLKFEDGDSQVREMIDPEFAARVEEILQGSAVPDNVKDEVWQAYLERMPDMSMRKSFIHRMNVPGYHFDALKAFGSSQFHGSYQIARLKYGMELQETIELAKEQTKPLRQIKPKDAIDADKLIGEIEKRHAFVMNPKGGTAAQVVTTAAFLYSLGANPAHLFLNATQTVMLGVPVLGSRYGFKRTAAALGRAVADFARGKGNLDKANLSADDRKAFQSFMDSGLIDKTQAHDLAGVGETGVEYSAVRQKVMNKIGWFFHQSERFNREVTAMAAYRLARADGRNHEAAVALAINHTYTIHFDYSAASRARFMQGDTAKALLVFRNYNVNMLYRLFRDINDSLRGESPQVKREARKQLGAMMGMYGLFAGTMGMPFYGLAMALAGLGDDDDDPVTAEQQFVNGTVEFLGPTAASLLLRGLPGTAFDIDLSERIGMPNLWFRSPQQEMEGRDSYYYWMEQLLGAGVGPVKGAIDGFNLIMGGQIQRGLERAMPAALRNPMQAIRQAQEGGVTSLDGDLIKETTGGDYIAKAMGFQPLSVSEQYDKNSNLKNADRRLSNRREKLLNQYFLAIQMGDDTAEVMADVQAFNVKNPDYAITRDTFRRSARLRNRNKLLSENGIVMTRRMRRLQERTEGDQE